jgi:hypothetical protein
LRLTFDIALLLVSAMICFLLNWHQATRERHP